MSIVVRGMEVAHRPIDRRESATARTTCKRAIANVSGQSFEPRGAHRSKLLNPNSDSQLFVLHFPLSTLQETRTGAGSRGAVLVVWLKEIDISTSFGANDIEGGGSGATANWCRGEVGG